jgi:hypothetical protein
MGKFFAILGIVCLLAAPRVARAEAVPTGNGATPPASGDHARVDGFRGAKWGMTESDVKAAIVNEFKVSPDKLKSEPNPNERTTVLTIILPELIDGAGTARVSYIFGYTTKKLIQVNVAWGVPPDPQVKPEMIVAAANQLRDLFVNAGYEPGTIVANARTSDGEIVVFEGQDADKHTTLLRLATTQPAPDKGSKPDKDKPAPTAALFLSYIMDSGNPDVFRLKKGQF